MKKIGKYLLFFLIGILGIFVLVFVFLNLPFTQAYATRQVNQILVRSAVPIHMDAIRKILPGSVRIQGISISGPLGDTMIYAGELQADIHLFSLARQRVLLRELELDGAVVELVRENDTQQINIARAFGGGKAGEIRPAERPPSKWRISIRKGKLSQIRFRMNDVPGGIHVAQNIALLELDNFHISLANSEIGLGSVYLSNADGQVNITQTLQADAGDKDQPWNLGFQKLALDNLDFAFSAAEDSIDIHAFIGSGSIRDDASDLLSGTVAFRKASLERSMLEIRGREVFHDLVLESEDLSLNTEQAGLKLKKMAFEMPNGFSLLKMSGELDAGRERTMLRADLRTGNSKLELEAYADESYRDISADPDHMSGARMELKRSSISLKDLGCFLPLLEEWPLYTSLAAAPVEVGMDLDWDGRSLEVSGLTLSQAENFHIRLDGAVLYPFDFQLASGNARLSVSGLGRDFTEELASVLGYARAFPDLSDLQIELSLSDSLKAPEFSLELKSHLGNGDIIGSLDIQRELFILGYALQEMKLGELLPGTGLGSFSGAGEIKGQGFAWQQLQAGFFMQLDKMEFKDYPYSNIQLTGTVEPARYGLQMVARDPSFQGDIQMEVERSDSLFRLHTSGMVNAQMDKLHLYGDTLNIQSSLDLNMVQKKSMLQTAFRGSDISLTTPERTAELNELNAFFTSDSSSTLFRAETDFLQAELNLARPFQELDSLVIPYRGYFASFREASHLTAFDRVSALPEVHASLSASYHELFGIILGDSGLRFERLDASIEKQADEKVLQTTLHGSDFSYNFLHTDEIKLVAADSTGFLLLDLVADSASLFSGPASRIRLKANASNRNMLANISVDDYSGRDLYHVEMAGRADSTQIFLEIPDRHLILNGAEWQLESPELLSIDLASNSLLPSLRMKRNSSGLGVSSIQKDSLISYELELDQVDLSSLVRKEMIKGKPVGRFSGLIGYTTDRVSDKKITTELVISDPGFYGQVYSPIRLDGLFRQGGSDSYEIDLKARADSLEVTLNGKRNPEGEQIIKGQFTHFPLPLLEPFLEKYVSDLRGSLSGDFDLSSEMGKERFAGKLLVHDAEAKVNLLNNVFRIPDQGIQLTDQRAVFDEFLILDRMDRPLNVNGYLSFQAGETPRASLNITSTELQVMSRDMRRNVPFTGNVFIDSRITVRGPLNQPDLAGNIRLSGGSEIYYHHMEDMKMTETEKLVNFVVDTSVREEFESPVMDVQSALGNSSIETVVEIDPSTRINLTLAKRMFDIILNVKGGGKVQYNLQNDQLNLSGRYEIGEGTTLLKLVGWPNKTFRLTRGGFIRWDGLVENPELSIEAENKISTSYLNPIDGNSRNIDFYVILRLTGYLEDLDVLFTIRTPDQYVMSIINTLSREEKMRQAMSVLLFEAIDLPGISSSTDYMTAQVNQILSSQLNQLTRSAIKGVDISFGLDTYDQASRDGGSETTTSLSYEVRKTFLNNRAKIEFSGRLKDANRETTTSDHSLNNLAFEYALDSAATKYLKVYNEHSYDDVFEGEVIRTGIGFTYRKRYKTVKDIWRRKK